jgi:hypothetical protein
MYQKYYKLGLDHFIYKKLLGLEKPKVATYTVYLALMGIIIAIELIR